MLPCFAYGYAHTCCRAWGFLCFLTIHCPPSGSGSTGSSGYFSPLGFPTFAMGSPLRGRGLFVPIWVRSTGQFMVEPCASVCGISARPVHPDVLLVGPRCVRELRLSFAPSSVLPCPMVQGCLRDPCCRSGVVLGTLPFFCQLGFCTSVGGSACALQPLAPSYRMVLTEAAGRGRFFVLSIVLPWQ